MKHTKYVQNIEYYEFNEEDLKDLIINKLYSEKGITVLRKDISLNNWTSSFNTRQGIWAKVSVV